MKKQLCTCSTLFCTFLCFARPQRETSRNFLATRFMKEMSYLLLFFTRSSFSPWWLLGFLNFSPPVKNFHVVLPTNSSLSSALTLCRSFFGWALLACRPLCFFSIFQICGHDNYSKLKTTLDNKDTEAISAFRFRLYWLFSCLCFTRSRWLCDFPPK